MKQPLMISAIIIVFIAGLILSLNSQAMSSGNKTQDIVGVWEVDADAPYRPHLFTFHQDGTLSTTNPTNVQENPTVPHGGTNDSLGMGIWKRVKIGNQVFVVGTFEQYNAFADNHMPTNKLSVSFKVKITNNGNNFDGPASAKIGSDIILSHLTGTRVVIDQNAINALP